MRLARAAKAAKGAIIKDVDGKLMDFFGESLTKVNVKSFKIGQFFG